MSWEKNGKYVLTSLERLEEMQKKQTDQIDEIHEEIVGFKTNQRWELRVMGVLWGFAVTVFNLLLGKHV